MPIRPIVTLPDPRLRLHSKPVNAPSAALRALISDMFATMYAAPGIGLAAIQIGVPLRVITLDVSKRDDQQSPMVLINPEITWHSEEMREYDEGCLSIPEYYETVTRPSAIRLHYLDADFTARERSAEGILATALQHEIDHLNGVLFIDHLSKLKRYRVIAKFRKATKAQKVS